MQPGSIAVWADGALQTRRYYVPPDREPRAGTRMDDGVEERFLERLDEAVRIRMVCDVPYGAFLSGGLDSSTTVALMSRHSAHAVKTFSVGFSDPRYSELPYARMVATQFRTEHRELVIEPQDLMERLPQAVTFRDAPVAEPADIPILMLAHHARQHVKMVLTGEGSDEILGGYPKHVFERWAALYQRVPSLLRAHVVEPIARSLPYGLRRAKTAVAALGLERVEQRLPRWFGGLDPAEIAALNGRLAPRVVPPAPPFDSAPGNSALRRVLYFDQASWLPDNLLERGDAMTMAASLEARMPFMDHELAAFVSSLPDRYRVRGTTTKWILRRAARRLLPAAILDRPKVGFRVPVNEWFRGPMRAYLQQHLLDEGSLSRSLFARAPLEALVTEHLAGAQNHEKTLWCLLNLELWKRHCLEPAQDARR
jgi:asparagine synthase (glutamine-hydrolysing)